MNLKEKISTVINQYGNVEFSAKSIQNANACAELFSNELNSLFSVMVSGSDIHYIEFYYDDELLYVDISFDDTSTSIYCRKKSDKFPHSDNEFFTDNVPIKEIYEIINGLMSFRKNT